MKATATLCICLAAWAASPTLAQYLDRERLPAPHGLPIRAEAAPRAGMEKYREIRRLWAEELDRMGVALDWRGYTVDDLRRCIDSVRAVRQPQRETRRRVGPKSVLVATLKPRGLEQGSATGAPALPLRILSQVARAEAGFAIVEGEVLNTGTRPLRGVQAVVSWYAPNGVLLTSESAPIAFEPLLPGQTSPFRVSVRGNPAMDRFIVTLSVPETAAAPAEPRTEADSAPGAPEATAPAPPAAPVSPQPAP